MRPLQVTVCCLLASACLTLAGSPAVATTNDYIESFTTKQYCDQVNTTALWDTVAGELKLPPFQIAGVGSYDTPGSARCVAVDGDYAYVADYGSGLLVIDIAEPFAPALAGSYDTPGSAHGVAVSGDYAYVTDYEAGLKVIDISDPASPTLAGSYDTPGVAYNVDVSGNHAFVCDGSGGGLQLLDITNPAAPTLAGSYDTPGYAYAVTISGDYAYLTDVNYGLQVIDISNPAAPTLAGSYNTSGSAYGVAVSGDYAYVADYGSGLQVIDITNPASPTLAATYNTPGYAYDVAISGDIAYVADLTSGLLLLDITDPRSPMPAGSCDTPGQSRSVVICGDYAYVADDAYGLLAIHVGSPVGPLSVGSWDAPLYYESDAIAVDGDYAYVAGMNALYVIDITSPNSPVAVGTYDPFDNVSDVAIAGDYAYAVETSIFGSTIEVLDVSDPTSVTAVGSYATGYASDLVIDGDYAFAATDDSLLVLDISDPANPTFAGHSGGIGLGSSVVVSGDYAYVADYYGLKVVDVSNPASPTLSGSYSALSATHDVAISGNYAYLAEDSYLEVVDITNPTSLASAGGYYATRDRANGVTISGNYAYVAEGAEAAFSGLEVIDISDPTSLAVAGSHATPEDAVDVVVAGDCAYVLGEFQGLYVMEIYQRRFITGSNVGRSLAIDESSNPIAGVRLSSVQADSIRWEISADGGANWTGIAPNNAWRILALTGSDLMWRSTHCYVPSGGNPTCTDLSIEWLYATPIIDGVADVPNDQGRQVSIEWTRNAHDAPGVPSPVTEYAVFRRIDEVDASSRSAEVHQQAADGGAALTYPPGKWQFVMTVPAYCEDYYSAVMPTLADSTSEGVYFTAFFVRAATATPSIYYDSPVDSGYSVDNLAPAPPPGLVMTSTTSLAWEESEAADFDYFTVYGSEAPELDPTATLIGYTSGMAMDIGGAAYSYYHVTATDFSGNEGEEASVENAYAGVRPGEELPTSFALKPSRPNPFSASTVIGFDLPVGCVVSLDVFDAQGRQVRSLADRAYPAGRHSVVWAGDSDSGRPLGSGIYFVRIEAGDFSARHKVMLTR